VNVVGGGYLALGPAADIHHFGSEEGFAAFKNDKYCYSGRIRLSMGNGLLAMTEHSQTLTGLVKFPFCLVHSADDDVVKVRGSRELFAKAQTQEGDKVYYEYDNMGHNVLNAPSALDKCFSWTQQRVDKFHMQLFEKAIV